MFVYFEMALCKNLSNSPKNEIPFFPLKKSGFFVFEVKCLKPYFYNHFEGKIISIFCTYDGENYRHFRRKKSLSFCEKKIG